MRPRPPRDKSNERWNLLRSRYRSHGLVLAFGAGISAGCGLPNWPELLLRVGERALHKPNGRDHVQQLIDVGTTFPAIAGILESKSPRSSQFSDLLREGLYRDFPFQRAIVTAKQRQTLVEFVRAKSPTMRAVTALCVEREHPKRE